MFKPLIVITNPHQISCFHITNKILFFNLTLYLKLRLISNYTSTITDYVQIKDHVILYMDTSSIKPLWYVLFNVACKQTRFHIEIRYLISCQFFTLWFPKKNKYYFSLVYLYTKWRRQYFLYIDYLMHLLRALHITMHYFPLHVIMAKTHIHRDVGNA